MELLFLFVAVLLGAVVQGAIGFGLALVVVPALMLASPETLPAVVLLVTMPMAAFMAFEERRAIDVSGLLYLFSGRILGTIGGVGILLVVPEEHLSVLFGSLLLLAVLTSAIRPEIPLSNRTRVAGGFGSGVMGTAAGIGGPPLALIYQGRSGPEIRATLAVAFAVGTLISLSTLAIFGRVGLEHLLLALELLPALFLGL